MLDMMVGLLLILFGAGALVTGLYLGHFDFGLFIVLGMVMLGGISLIICRCIMIKGKPKKWAIWLEKH